MEDGEDEKGWFTVYMFNGNRTSDIHPFSSSLLQPKPYFPNGNLPNADEGSRVAWG